VQWVSAGLAPQAGYLLVWYVSRFHSY